MPDKLKYFDGGINSFPAGSNKTPDTLIEAKYGYKWLSNQMRTFNPDEIQRFNRVIRQLAAYALIAKGCKFFFEVRANNHLGFQSRYPGIPVKHFPH